jgi:hypothetical protein
VGFQLADGNNGLAPVCGFPNNLQVRFVRQQSPQCRPIQGVVVHNNDSLDARHACSRFAINTREHDAEAVSRLS